MIAFAVLLLTMVGVALSGWHWRESRLAPGMIGMLLLVMAGCLSFLTAAAAGLVFCAAAAMVAIPVTAIAKALVKRAAARNPAQPTT